MRVSRAAIVLFLLLAGFMVAIGNMKAATLSTTLISNLLENADFEDGSYAPNSQPDYWSTDAYYLTDSTFIWDNTKSQSGNKSIKIESTTPNDARWIQVVPVRPYTRYRLSGWIKTENVDHTVDSVDAGANLSLLGEWTRSTGLLGTNDWTFVEIEFDSGTATEITVAARLGFWSGTTTGTAWFDNIRLEPIYNLTNGSFENGAYAPGNQPDNWDTDAFYATASTFVWDDTQAQSGSKSIMIDALTPNDARWIQTVTVIPHADYRLSGWVKTDNVGHTVDSVDAGANLSLLGEWTRSAGLLGTNDWTYESVEFHTGTATEITVAARLGFWSGITTGTAWFDNITLELINAPVDIMPFTEPNIISRRGSRLIPVTVLSSDMFDALAMVAVESLTFGRTGEEHSLQWRKHGRRASCFTLDANQDGLLDLTCNFIANKADFRCGNTEGILKGDLINGLPFEGRDNVQVGPCR